MVVALDLAVLTLGCRFELIHHFTQLHVDFGATQIGITNGNTNNGLDHAGTSSTDEVGTIGYASGGGELTNHLHNGGTSVGGFIHDFGHNHIDNVTGSDVNGSDGIFGNGDDINQGNWFEHSQYLRTDQIPSDDFVVGGRHINSSYANNDTDNNKYWGGASGSGCNPNGSGISGCTAGSASGYDNGWQRDPLTGGYITYGMHSTGPISAVGGALKWPRWPDAPNTDSSKYY
ncbi:hypothetical protein GUITHDRAFT_142615 [Guillardia theta CCMP2712]|uniref:Uncharacterized protein n=1 Tax=Guillardia theta (strain CCMP2712) TaxID=905079 RepID=L1IWV8_GUITC|nr:hypothetical protein GUITHDRAFT_142615 [Guillardia theta CCMP2712]EKX40753.1 hypothetical protein GUITHDRAFT_142615 [Guillardia theta CCMP2712]|eukprot:XP_005827733.1 hypothetical protein GUITHDRAFT_142615 [Guillardia theta CCMP2712]